MGTDQVRANFIDTADGHGPHSNEELSREALHPYPGDLVIATEGGFVRGGPDYGDLGAVGNRNHPRQAAHMSARRLGLDHIGLYCLHTPATTDGLPIAASARCGRSCYPA
ncbi:MULTISPECIES: aldo/keto reductase [unclassified Streptomyces]|uniref:aldo/keto reductase n=1 Tax=unclassified Streptomyces TaxID=2593676 RepID=UPI002F9070C5